MRTLLLFSAFLFCFAHNVAMATEGKPPVGVLEGKVLDASNFESLVGAEVQIPDLGLKTYCDFNGQFHFDGLPQGTYKVKIKFVSYEEAEYVEIEVGPKTKIHKFLLESR